MSVPQYEPLFRCMKDYWKIMRLWSSAALVEQVFAHSVKELLLAFSFVFEQRG